MPPQILHTYRRYLENLTTRYQFGQHLGKGCKNRCSIPQGCPFSMTMVALLLRPWIKYMESMKVTPRCLADDLLIMTEGIGHRMRTIKALEASIQFFEDIGAKVAPNKCFMFGTTTATRTTFRNQPFNIDGKGLYIPVKKCFPRSWRSLKFYKIPKWVHPNQANA